jgi:hypothetical protein
MTDRVQPGAIDSIIRNDELSQIFGQFGSGYVIPPSEGPTPAAIRRGDIDETALNGFALTSVSGFDVTIAPGEAFVGGWCARDVDTTITVDPNTTATIVVGWDLDAVFDPNVNTTRDEADQTIVDKQSAVDATDPTTDIFEIETDSNGIISTTDARALGPALDVESIDISDALELPIFQTKSSVPALAEGAAVFVADEGQIFFEDGN